MCVQLEFTEFTLDSPLFKEDEKQNGLVKLKLFANWGQWENFHWEHSLTSFVEAHTSNQFGRRKSQQKHSESPLQRIAWRCPGLLFSSVI